MRITFLFLSLAAAIGISLTVSPLTANDTVRPDVALEAAAATDTDQAEQTVVANEVVPTIMIEVFEAADDTPPVETDADLTREVEAADLGNQNAGESEATQEIEASPEATTEVSNESADTEILAREEASDDLAKVVEEPAVNDVERLATDDETFEQVAPSDETVEVVEEISEEVATVDANEISVEETIALECSEEVEAVADETIALEAEEVVSEEPVVDAVEELVTDDEAFEQVAPSDDADEISVEETIVLECSEEVEAVADETIALETEEVASEEPAVDAVEELVTDDEAFEQVAPSDDADEISVEETIVLECSEEVEAVADETIALETEEVVSEEPAVDAVEELVTDDEAFEQVAPSDDADEISVEETIVLECSDEVEAVANEAIALETEEVASEQPAANEVELAATDDEALVEVAQHDEAVAIVEQVSDEVVADADSLMCDEAFDAWATEWAGGFSDPNKVTDEGSTPEDGTEAVAIEEVDADTYVDCAADELVDSDTDTALEVADAVIDAVEVQEETTESTPAETLDAAEPATVRTIQLDGCTITIASDVQMDDFQLVDALWSAVNELEIQMD